MLFDRTITTALRRFADTGDEGQLDEIRFALSWMRRNSPETLQRWLALIDCIESATEAA